MLEKQNLNTKDYCQISKTKTPEEALHELLRVRSSNFIGIYVCLCLSFKLPVAVIKFYTSNYRFVLISTRSKFFHGHKDYYAIQKWIFQNSFRIVCYRIFWPYIFDGTLNIKLSYMSHFAYACKMRYPLNLVLESWEYLWFYWTFCIVILDYGLKLHKLSNHTLVMLQKWLEIH